MATPLYFRQYHTKKWDHLSEEEQAACIKNVDFETRAARQKRVPRYGDRPVGVAALPNGGFTFLWGVQAVDEA